MISTANSTQFAMTNGPLTVVRGLSSIPNALTITDEVPTARTTGTRVKTVRLRLRKRNSKNRAAPARAR